MCGISGLLRFDGRPVDPEMAQAPLQAQAHRGPDATGTWSSGEILLAHNRLTIIDHSGGAQPMSTEDGGAVVVFNGEIYNYQELRRELQVAGHVFKSNSDTEVLLRAFANWGQDCLKRLRGMYAFAIWDANKGSLFLARDRMGIKPLFYSISRDGIRFASELQGLLALPGPPCEVDPGALDLYLHYQYVPSPFTIYRGVQKLPPAHSLTIDAQGRCDGPKSYWDVSFQPEPGRSEESWLEEMEATISESVRMHLMSDVPFGAFLSGGIDSSTVAALMAKYLEGGLDTFTIGFEEAAYDERPFAVQAAAEIGARHHVRVIAPDEVDILDSLLPKLARHYGEPFADSSAVPTYYVSQLAAQKVKMVLSGDGGDELFAGYNTYPAILEPGPEAAGGLRGALRRLLGAPPGDVSQAAQARPLQRHQARHGEVYAYFQDAQRRALYRPHTSKAMRAANPEKHMAGVFAAAKASDALGVLQYVDLKTYLPGDILQKVDVASMMHSIEVRVPLLDHKVVELAARVPTALKLHGGPAGLEKKYLLKRFAARFFSPGFFERPKQGFGVPIDHWLSGRYFAQTRERINDPGSVLADWFEPQALAGMTATPEAVRGNAPRVWALLFLDEWARQWSAPREFTDEEA